MLLGARRRYDCGYCIVVGPLCLGLRAVGESGAQSGSTGGGRVILLAIVSIVFVGTILDSIMVCDTCIFRFHFHLFMVSK